MKWVLYGLVGVILFVVVFADRLFPDMGVSGTITKIESQSNGPIATELATVELANRAVSATIYETQIPYHVGDRVLLSPDGNAPGTYTVADFMRVPALIQIFGIFLIAVIVTAGWAGFRSLAGLYISFAILFSFVLPQITMGANPLVVTLLASMVILVVSYYLAHGLSTKTTIAVVGTAITLLFVGLLAVAFGNLAHLTGFGSEEAAYLPADIASPATIYQLLLAGVIIATLGVLNDITIAQASVVLELSNANKRLTQSELYARGMRVGHDHIASLVNTLVLVYAGSALPLLLLFEGSHETLFALINYEAIAEEILRTMVGSIGLVAAVPVTTFLAAYWYTKKKR